MLYLSGNETRQSGCCHVQMQNSGQPVVHFNQTYLRCAENLSWFDSEMFPIQQHHKGHKLCISIGPA